MFLAGPPDGLKHYTVNDIQFDPSKYVSQLYNPLPAEISSPRRAMSCAYDNKLFIWDFEHEDQQSYPLKVGECESDNRSLPPLAELI